MEMHADIAGMAHRLQQMTEMGPERVVSMIQVHEKLSRAKEFRSQGLAREFQFDFFCLLVTRQHVH